jgi:hypothetical protein
MQKAARRLASAAAIVGLMIAVPVATASSGASAPPSTVGGGVFSLHSMADQSFCLDVVDQGSGLVVVVSMCTAAESQKFALSHGADGLNLMLDSHGNCLAHGAKIGPGFFAVGDGPCKYKPIGRWSILADGLVTQGDSGLCLTIPRAADGANVHLVPCQEVPLQEWKLSQ